MSHQATDALKNLQNMNTISILNIGLAGLQRAQADVRQNATKIVSAGISDTSATMTLSTSMVKLLSDRLQAQAAAIVIKTADEMLGTVLDIRV